MKRYSNFEQIDQDLKYLRLKSRIDMEQVRLSINTSKETFKETFSPVNVIASALASIIKRAFILKVVDKLIGIKPVKKSDY